MHQISQVNRDKSAVVVSTTAKIEDKLNTTAGVNMITLLNGKPDSL